MIITAVNSCARTVISYLFFNQKGTAIHKMSSAFLKNHNESQSWSEAHYYDYETNSNDWTKNGFCASLPECFSYQACVFDFGNEFCRRDPQPGQRKIMMVNITCSQQNLIKDQKKVQFSFSNPNYI